MNINMMARAVVTVCTDFTLCSVRNCIYKLYR